MKFKDNLWPPVQNISLKKTRKIFQKPAKLTVNWCAPQAPLPGIVRLAEEKNIILRHQRTKDIFALSLGGQTAGKAPAELGRQGYRIEVSSEGIIVSANTVEGLNNSVFKLFELLRFSSLPELQINDWPNCEHRGVMIDLARVVESPDFIISLLPFLAECRLNQVYLYLENKLQLESHPKLAHPMAWSKAEMRALINAAKDFGIEIVPMIATIGHMESILTVPEYRRLRVPDTDDHLETSLPEAGKFMRDVIEEVCELFDSKYIHLAGDECPYLGGDSRTLTRKYADFMNFMADILNEYGRQGIIWADMVEKYPDLLKLLSRKLILTVWKYGPVDDRPVSVPDEFIRAGFNTAVAPGIMADEPFLPAVERLTKNLPFLTRHTGLWGVINCMWEPRTQNLSVARLGIAVAGACSWNPFAIETAPLLCRASEFTYGEDISKLYKLLEGKKFFDMMVNSKFAFYHSFELSCNNPLIHLTEPVSSEWRRISTEINAGIDYLKNSECFSGRHRSDRKAFEACGTLAKTLADSVVLTRALGKKINAGGLREIADMSPQIRLLTKFMHETLKIQKEAWKACRRTHDPNYDWWFREPLLYKIKCLDAFADYLDAGPGKEAPALNYLLFRFNKGNAASWNLLRIKIFYSECGGKWEQVFFKTIPLWMDDSLDFKLMPYKGKLPDYIKIVPVYATWHREGGDWSDMIEILCGKINLFPGELYNETVFPATDIYALNSTASALMLQKR